MKTYARIADGVVAELLVTGEDISALFHPCLRWLAVADPRIQVGWREGSDGFAAPPPMVDALHAPSLTELRTELAMLTARVAALQA